MLGSSNSGKTSFVNKLVKSNNLYLTPTIGVEFTTKRFYVKDKILEWKIWDCGFSKNLDLLTSYILKSDIFFLFLDLSVSYNRQNTLKVIETIYNLKEKPKIILLCSKADLKSKIDDVNIDFISNKFNLDYFKISTKDDSIKYFVEKINKFILKNVPTKELKNIKIVKKREDRPCCWIF